MRLTILLLLSLLITTGCASIPESVSGDYFTDITPDQARTTPERANAANVRWGGIIVEVINNEEETWIEVLAMPLSDSAKPRSNRQDNLGRFIAKTRDFLDPEVYQKGLSITFVGTITSSLEGKVGERAYNYPVITVRNHYLWPRQIYNRTRYVVPGFWYYGYHPFWRFGYPFYGYGVWGYNVFHPYYPVYGYLHRSNEVIPRNRVSGDFSYSTRMNWPRFHQLRAGGHDVRNRHYFSASDHAQLRQLQRPQRNATSDRRSSSRAKPTARPKPARSSSNTRKQPVDKYK